jgi:uncharacterized membrane protein
MKLAGVCVEILVLVFLVWMLAMAFVTVATSATCLKAGYSGAKVTWDFTRYCARRVMQTDVVVPLAVIQQKPLQ